MFSAKTLHSLIFTVITRENYKMKMVLQGGGGRNTKKSHTHGKQKRDGVKRELLKGLHFPVVSEW